MCNRFVDPNMRSAGLDTSWLKINPFPRRYNIAPTEQVYILRPDGPALARWGLIPGWHKGEVKDWKAMTTNARIEEVTEKPTYRDAWKRGRILLPAGGYYEWTGEKTPKQPHLFTSAGNEDVIWFAGLYTVWRDLLTCTIMTRAANASVDPIHDRMPVILDTAEREAWMAGSEDRDIGAGARLKHHKVRPFGIRDEGPELIHPA